MRKLWLSFAGVVVVSFLVLGWLGVRIYQQGAAHPARSRDDHGHGGGSSG